MMKLSVESCDGKTNRRCLPPHVPDHPVTLRHTGVPDDEQGRQHKDGWDWIVSMLGERFEAPPLS